MKSPSQASCREAMTTRVAFELPHTDAEKLGEILGFLVGDGTVCLKKGRIAFSNSEIFCIKKMLDNFENIFGVDRNKFNYYLTVSPCSDAVKIKNTWKNHLFLQKNIRLYTEERAKKKYGRMLVMISNHSATEQIHNFLKIIFADKETNPHTLLGFLRGFFAAEGTIIPGKTNRVIPNSIQFPQKGKDMPKLISKILWNFRIENRVVIKQKKADYYCVNVTGFENFNKLQKMNIAVLHPEKAKKLENGIKSYTKTVSRKFKLPIKLLRALEKKSMTRSEIYSFLDLYPQRVNGMLYSKSSYLVKNKLIAKSISGTGIITWQITDAGRYFLKDKSSF